MNLSASAASEKRAWIYVKDNGAVHASLGARAVGAVGTLAGTGPAVEIAGRPLRRTWSLLAEPLEPWQTSLRVMHDPASMGWMIGDRIQVAPTTAGSDGEAQTFVIESLGAYNRINLASHAWAAFGATAEHIARARLEPIASLRAAEVIHLTRSVVLTGDDFSHIPCDPTLGADPHYAISSAGCHCRAGVRSKCPVLLFAHIFLYSFVSSSNRFVASARWVRTLFISSVARPR